MSLSDVNSLVGGHFKQTLSKSLNKNTVSLQSTAADRRAFDLHGFQNGYLIGFGSLHPSAFKNGKVTFTKGISSVTSAVFTFKASSGASWMFNYGKNETSSAFKREKAMHVHISGQSGLGDTAVRITTATKLSPTLGTLNTVSFLWRRGSYLAEVAIGGYGSISGSQAIALAKLVDTRIDHLG